MNNKNIRKSYSIILIITLLVILATVLISKNSSVITNKSLWKYKLNGGIPFQCSISILSYLGITTSSIFDEDIKNDMDSINWNIFNIDEKKVIDSQKVSFYKGVPVFKFNHNRSGSFGAIFITSGLRNTDVVRHEWGHNVQLLLLGPIKYGLCIGLPSWLEWSNKPYYDRPWEITADIFGGVISRNHNNYDIQRGFEYLNISAMFGILSFSFLPGEY